VDPIPHRPAPGEDDHEEDSPKNAQRHFYRLRNGGDGGPAEAYYHIEVLPSANVAAQGVSAIRIAPEVEFIAIVLGEQ
jgi:hypothetical protein